MQQGAAPGGTYIALTFAFASIPTAPDEQSQEEDIETEAEESSQDNHLLRKEEEKKEGAVAFQVYKAYWLAVGSCLALSILFSLLLMQGEAMSQEHVSLYMFLSSCFLALWSPGKERDWGFHCSLCTRKTN